MTINLTSSLRTEAEVVSAFQAGHPFRVENSPCASLVRRKELKKLGVESAAIYYGNAGTKVVLPVS